MRIQSKYRVIIRTHTGHKSFTVKASSEMRAAAAIMTCFDGDFVVISSILI